MKKYAIISNKKRNQLVLRVAANGESVSRVAKQLRMKLPSAKSILRTYKQSGRIFDKKKIMSRGARAKKNYMPQTEHHQSQEELKLQKSESGFKIEALENGQSEVKLEVKFTQNEQKFHQIAPFMGKAIDELVSYRNYLQICLQKQLSDFNRLIGSYRIHEFLQKHRHN